MQQRTPVLVRGTPPPKVLSAWSDSRGVSNRGGVPSGGTTWSGGRGRYVRDPTNSKLAVVADPGVAPQWSETLGLVPRDLRAQKSQEEFSRGGGSEEAPAPLLVPAAQGRAAEQEPLHAPRVDHGRSLPVVGVVNEGRSSAGEGAASSGGPAYIPPSSGGPARNINPGRSGPEPRSVSLSSASSQSFVLGDRDQQQLRRTGSLDGSLGSLTPNAWPRLKLQTTLSQFVLAGSANKLINTKRSREHKLMDARLGSITRAGLQKAKAAVRGSSAGDLLLSRPDISIMPGAPRPGLFGGGVVTQAVSSGGRGEPGASVGERAPLVGNKRASSPSEARRRLQGAGSSRDHTSGKGLVVRRSGAPTEEEGAGVVPEGETSVPGLPEGESPNPGEEPKQQILAAGAADDPADPARPAISPTTPPFHERSPPFHERSETRSHDPAQRLHDRLAKVILPGSSSNEESSSSSSSCNKEKFWNALVEERRRRIAMTRGETGKTHDAAARGGHDATGAIMRPGGVGMGLPVLRVEPGREKYNARRDPGAQEEIAAYEDLLSQTCQQEHPL